MKIFISLLLLLLFCLRRRDAATFDRESVNLTYIRESFDWRAFIELYPESVSKIHDEETAIQYYLKYHHQQSAYDFPRRFPSFESLQRAKSKLNGYNSLLEKHSIPIANRTLILYHIGWMNTENSFDVTINNVKHFVNVMVEDSLQPIPNAFYWVNILGGQENILYRFFPPEFFLASSTNIALLEWGISPSDMYSHFRTLEILRQEKLLTSTSFSTVIFLNNEARGPLSHPSDWIEKFRDLLSFRDNVLVGPILSCEVKPHIQTHAFAIRSAFVEDILSHYRSNGIQKLKHWRYVIKHYEIGLSSLAVSKNLTIGSFLYLHRTGEYSFQGKCLKTDHYSGFQIDKNPMRWCHLPTEEVLFMKWGGSPFRKSGFICPQVKKKMDHYLSHLANQTFDRLQTLLRKDGVIDRSKFLLQLLPEKVVMIQDLRSQSSFPLALDFSFPETLRGGFLLDLYKQFDQEQAIPAHIETATKQQEKRKSVASSACFFTNVYGSYPFHLPRRIHDPLAHDNNNNNNNWNEYFIFQTMKADFDRYIQSLYRQTDPHWLLFLILAIVKPTIPKEFRFTKARENQAGRSSSREEYWEESSFNYTHILTQFRTFLTAVPDSRLRIVEFPLSAEYESVSDLYDLLRQQLLAEEDASSIQSCQWIMFSSITSLYGSKVIENLRSVSLPPPSSTATTTSSGRVKSEPSLVLIPMDSKRFIYQDLNNRILPHWNYHCLHHLSFLQNHPLGFFHQPLPAPEQLDLASVAFPVRSFRSEPWLYFRKLVSILFCCFSLIIYIAYSVIVAVGLLLLLLGNFTPRGYRYFPASSTTSSSSISTDPTVARNHQISPSTHTYYDPQYREFLIQGQFLQYLVRYRRWTYLRLPVNGLSSLVLDQNAPTYCLAAGHVWFDHPITSFANCYSSSQVDRLHIMDIKARNAARQGKGKKSVVAYSFDWKEFERNQRMCLRLGKDLYYQTLLSYPALHKYLPSQMKKLRFGALVVNESISISSLNEMREVNQDRK